MKGRAPLAYITESTAYRDNDWLIDRLAEIWYRHFSDVTQLNEIIIVFGRKSRTRLGSIGMPGWQDQTKRLTYAGHKRVATGTSVITITGYFADPRVPSYVVDATIGHELVHYAHGFHSPHPQRYQHPHQGNIVNQELEQRGMAPILKEQQQWLKQEWRTIIGPTIKRKRRRRVRVRLSFLPPY
jgi:hypothetical protein